MSTIYCFACNMNILCENYTEHLQSPDHRLKVLNRRDVLSDINHRWYHLVKYSVDCDRQLGRPNDDPITTVYLDDLYSEVERVYPSCHCGQQFAYKPRSREGVVFININRWDHSKGFSKGNIYFDCPKCTDCEIIANLQNDLTTIKRRERVRKIGECIQQIEQQCITSDTARDNLVKYANSLIDDIDDIRRQRKQNN